MSHEQNNPLELILLPGNPEFLDLPWHKPISDWDINNCPRKVEVPRGISRHPVVFVIYGGTIYTLKDMPGSRAKSEYDLILQIGKLRVPTVVPIGYGIQTLASDQRSILITRYLDHSIPFRNLFAQPRLTRYREHLLDAIASLLVQLHLAGIFWGDCSLSNTLFRQDAGALQAYLVDAETAEIFPNDLPPTLRHQDLQIMEQNIHGELADLDIDPQLTGEYPSSDIGAYIRLRYQMLWEEITREDIIYPGEHYRIQERIRALNALGFSVGDVELRDTDHGDQLRLRVVITDRNFHRAQLLSLTGLEVEERQARLMMNEIQELKATLSKNQNRNVPLSVAAYHWINQIYTPTLKLLQPLLKADVDAAELYCQVLENKWFLSEKAKRDVGHQKAAEDYIERFATL